MSLDQIQLQIRDAEQAVNRNAGSTTLIAVSKLQPSHRVLEVLQHGHLDFGENRVQEAAGKWPEFKEQFPQVVLHLLGPLQSNKVRQAMGLFDVIHAVDRLSLAERIARVADEQGRCPKLFIQVNTGEEKQKSGVVPAETDALVQSVQNLNLPLVGLMCIPPINEEPALHFGLLGNIARRNGLNGLSMGMSSDFVSAVRLGATHVRVGTAIFGTRERS